MINLEDMDTICHFLNQQHVLTLCAGNGLDMWCANCFYVFDQSLMTLNLMTEKHTRHGELMQSNNQIVGTVATQPIEVALIKGIQYRGEIFLLSGVAEKTARQHYCQRFPVARNASTPVWKLCLLEIKMTNNLQGFAKKLLWVK